MLILTLRTDKPEAEIGLYDDAQQLVYETWTAHRALGQTIHGKISEVLQRAGKELSALEAVVVFRGPGSFTGLRIGITVANTLSYALPCKVAGSMGDKWIEDGVERLLRGESDKLVIPEYGSEAHITLPKK